MMRTVVEVLAHLYDSRQAAAEVAERQQDTLRRGLAIGMADGIDLAIEALSEMPLMTGRCS